MGGIVKGVGSIITGPKGAKKYSSAQSRADQKYTAEMQQKYGTYGVDSPLGTLNLVTDPETGITRKSFESSDADNQRNELIGQGLSQLSLDPTQAQDAYYNQATRLLTPQFENQTERLDENLINRGISMGSEQYDRQTENLRNQQAGTLSDIANQSVFAGQDLLGSQIGNIGSLAGQRDIAGLNALGGGTGTNFTPTYDKVNQSQNYARQLQNQQNQQSLSDAGQIASVIALSDRRLKENLIKVGKLDNGLNVYIGNYNDKAIEIDPTLNKKPQLFLIAQEVEKVNKNGVVNLDNGYKAVNYKEAVKNG